MKMKRVMKYYIKQRDNYQAPIYYVPMGQMSKAAAKRNEKPLAGYNIMIEYETEKEYLEAIEKLKSEGKRVH